MSQERELTVKKLYLEQKNSCLEDGKEVVLTSKEFALLEYFMTHKGVALSRDKLLTEVWGYSYVGETRTVDVHVRHLREKLGECGKAIETVKGLGYRFDGE